MDFVSSVESEDRFTFASEDLKRSDTAILVLPDSFEPYSIMYGLLLVVPRSEESSTSVALSNEALIQNVSTRMRVRRAQKTPQPIFLVFAERDERRTTKLLSGIVAASRLQI
ncbi:MAG: hypothetical protein EGQ66_00635 [Coriobacteriaceae bacterium]|nr:hypothetical protein [Coriobacteriaceae bacterium]